MFKYRFPEFPGDLYSNLVEELCGEFASGKNVNPVVQDPLVAFSSIGKDHLILPDVPEVGIEPDVQPAMLHGVLYLHAVPGFDPVESLIPVRKDHLVVVA